MSSKKMVALKSVESDTSSKITKIKKISTTTTTITTNVAASSTSTATATSTLKKATDIGTTVSAVLGDTTNILKETNNNELNEKEVKDLSKEKGVKKEKKSSDSTGKKKTKKSKKSTVSNTAKEKVFVDLVVQIEKNCKACCKPVYKMEEIKAEKSIWHKQCFKCSECCKALTIDTYESHESILYCKPHFKALFVPKAVENNEPVKIRKPGLIICESQPVELPSDVVRSSDKVDLGLDELHQLNVKSRYQVFENPTNNGSQEQQTKQITTGVKRSASILSKLAKFQSKKIGSIGEVDDDENNDDENNLENEIENSDDDSDLEEYGEDDDIDLIRAKRRAGHRERPPSFANMNEVKSRFEGGHEIQKEERREERKQEIQNIRSRLFMGKQAKIKEMYQQAVLESEQGGPRAVDKKSELIDVGDKARLLKNKFETGKIFKNGSDNDDENENQLQQKVHDEEMAVFEEGLGKLSRSIFMEMDANIVKTPQTPPASTTTVRPFPNQMSPPVKRNIQPLLENIVKSDVKTEEIKIETADISNKFKFFETYKPTVCDKKQFRITPPREGVVKESTPENDQQNDIYIDPNIIRADEKLDDPNVLQNSHTTTKMLLMFREMEKTKNETNHQDGMKPLKRFTPPPDGNNRNGNHQRGVNRSDSESENDHTYDSDEEEEDDDDEEEEEEDEDEENGGEQHENDEFNKSSNKNMDEILQLAQSAARAKQLRAKFERWESNEILREQNNSSFRLFDGEDQSQVETAKNIRAKFELMKNQPNLDQSREKIKVNRFL